MTDKIKVAVRVRPFNRRECELGAASVVEMDGHQTILSNPGSLDKAERKQPKTFAFDCCFYSVDPDAENFASQQKVFDSIGRDILENAFQGYNACVFAYGQTGSGKSYTMMGTQENKGIIPRLCDELFASIAVKETPTLLYKVEVSYIEIYNEKVHDLLDPKPNKQSLKVREHNVFGPYVDGLSQLAVTSFEDIDVLMAEGNKSRTVAATNMNAESSRSHAVFSVILTQILTDPQSGVSGEKVSRMSLVDLAGSERAVKTGTVGERLKEGSNINKSLTTLGLVISKLADQSNGRTKSDKFVPYRDSVLTWLLKDNLGGNSRTVMLATVSPASDNYEETLSTLRYADRAKRIVNCAVINEDPNAKIIRELRLEVENLRNMLKHATGSLIGDTQQVDLHNKLTESENLMKQVSQTWEEKLVKTERIQSERQQALEKMGISVQASGIKVEKDKYYLVNLNADPSLNELLVYYLKKRTLVGGHSHTIEPDIQLFGLGIQPEHCILTINEGELYMEPLDGSRCFVNGSSVCGKVTLQHGDRILWGNHHFFRVNCPKISSNVSMSSEPQTPVTQIDYHFARDEIMQNELSNDPIQIAIAKLERQHEEDKQFALEKQRQVYERQFQQLRNILSPTTPYPPYHPYDPLRMGKLAPYTPTSQMRVEKWAQERDEMFKRSLGQLKMDIIRANSLVQEANFLADELGRKTKFSVTLQIPPANLSPNRKRGSFVSEPAILIKRTNSGNQVWSMEKLENKLIDMREMYQEHKEKNAPDLGDGGNILDPFYESQENHNLIGVANIFLEILFHDVKLEYQTPIISQQGEVAGRLLIEISRTAGQLPQDRMCESISDSSTDSRDEESINEMNTTQITCRVNIKQAYGLPLSLSNFVFCQYTFWSHQEVVVPVINSQHPVINQNSTFYFNHEKDYTVNATEEFLEHCTEGALSIEVWGHRSAGFSKSKGWEVEQQQAKARSLIDRWAELSRKIELWIEIHELNDNGEYAPVEVTNRSEVLTGGIYQLRQGQQKRIQVHVKPVQNSGTLPIICQSIIDISVGSITVRSKLQKSLDSYQEEDLNVLREKWSEALGRRRKYLDEQIQRLIKKENKTEEERERELNLVHQWISLTEERNAVLVPAPASGIPGAPASWDPPPGMEAHVPVLFLDLNADDLSAQNISIEFPLAGLNSILSKEHGNKFHQLQILQHFDKDVSGIASWDSSLHENNKLNRMTEANDRVYMILKTTVRLSHPAPMDLVLRKRLTLNIYKRQSIAEKLKKFRFVRGEDAIFRTGVTYEIVSNIPKASEELEDRESLAQLAASGNESFDSDGETYIEKYTRGVSAVESILILDRLRQNVAVKELEQSQCQALTMRKTVSVPNFSQIMRLDMSMESLTNLGRSESYADLNDSSLSNDKMIAWPSNFKQKASPAANKLSGMRMTTLHEEPILKRSLSDNSDSSSNDYEDVDLQYVSINDKKIYKSRMSVSRTMDSLLDTGGVNNFNCISAITSYKNLTGLVTPSMSSSTSSGYGSQATSYSNLANDDATSLRSECLDRSLEFNSSCRDVQAAVIEFKNKNTSSDQHFRFNPFMKSSLLYDCLDLSDNSKMEVLSDKELTLTSSKKETLKLPTKEIINDLESETNDKNQNLIDDINHNSTHVKFTLKEDITTDIVDHNIQVKKKKTIEKNTHRKSFGFCVKTNKVVSDKLNVSEKDIQKKEELIEDDVKNNLETIPNWMNVGESVLIRPYNSSGIICFIGSTHFQNGIWVGVELNTPTGKNNGTVQGIQYFSCKPKHGIFVRYDKLMPDKRGKLIRAFKLESNAKSPDNNSAQIHSKTQSRK